MRFLIDGYNLAHQLTLPAGTVSAERLARARDELLAHLADRHGDSAGTVTIVFDCRRTRGMPEREIVRGMDVRHALGESADDVIERLIAAHATPKKLSVVSDDRRIQVAARKRQSRVLGCQQYLDELDRPAPPAPAPAEEKGPAIDPAGDAALLREFTAPGPRRPGRKT
ncbi:MAG: NYN domain-containing protein [Gemmataceae bacterium]|nr:NYN domain-containing protein [Gemmataceae bacterium]